MQKNHKVLAVLACLALAAGTMAGCTTPAPPADSAPARTEEGTANPLNDGRLRYLYDLNSSGGGTLLRGCELLYRASPSVRLPLLFAHVLEDPACWQHIQQDTTVQRNYA